MLAREDGEDENMSELWKNDPYDEKDGQKPLFCPS